MTEQEKLAEFQERNGMRSLRLRKTSIEELDQIRELYWKLLDSSPKYGQILQWKKNIYPNDGDWTAYIRKGEMYLILQEADVIGAVAVTNGQSEEYRKIHWTVKIEDQEAAVVHLLMIVPEYQGQGVATAALDEIIKLAVAKKKKAVRLDAIGTNVPAQKLYEKYGFVNCGTAQEYYESTGETEFIFYEYVLAEQQLYIGTKVNFHTGIVNESERTVYMSESGLIDIIGRGAAKKYKLK